MKLEMKTALHIVTTTSMKEEPQGPKEKEKKSIISSSPPTMAVGLKTPIAPPPLKATVLPLNTYKVKDDDHSPKSGTFVKKLYTMVESESSDVVEWIRNGTAFHIKDPKVMSDIYLPKYFRHGKFSSLIRQLNFYSFYKVQEGSHVIYQHSYFQQGKPELLVEVKRRLNGKAKDPWVDPLRDTPFASHVVHSPVDPSPLAGVPLATPATRPSILDTMSPLNKPGMPGLILPPAVLGPMGFYKKSLSGKRSHHHFLSSSQGKNKMAAGKRLSMGSPPLDICDILYEDDDRTIPTLEEKQPLGLSILARDCLKDVEMVAEEKDIILEVNFDLPISSEECWTRPLSPLNSTEQLSSWIDVASW